MSVKTLGLHGVGRTLFGRSKCAESTPVPPAPVVAQPAEPAFFAPEQVPQAALTRLGEPHFLAYAKR